MFNFHCKCNEHKKSANDSLQYIFAKTKQKQATVTVFYGQNNAIRVTVIQIFSLA